MRDLLSKVLKVPQREAPKDGSFGGFLFQNTGWDGFVGRAPRHLIQEDARKPPGSHLELKRESESER